MAAGAVLVLGVVSLGLLAFAAEVANPALPGDTVPSRTIEISMIDGLRFRPDQVTVRAGETIRFVVVNPTLFDHEFVTGDELAQQMHAAAMAAGSMRDDSHAVSVRAGETRELLYTFEAAGDTEIACHVPGHYEAGMRAAVTINP